MRKLGFERLSHLTRAGGGTDDRMESAPDSGSTELNSDSASTATIIARQSELPSVIISNNTD